MRNHIFNISFDEKTGNVVSISNPKDEYNMNWCAENSQWGKIYCDNLDGIYGDYEKRIKHMTLVSFEEKENEAISIYSNGRVDVSVKRFFRENGNFVERYTFKNTDYADFFISPDNCGISVPFNDRYTYADECMTNRCNTHIWCACDISYVNALKMGISDINMGLVLTKGRLHSYSQKQKDIEGGHSRGEFVLNLDKTELIQNEEYVIEWELFWHNGSDFYEKAAEITDFVKIEAEQFTVFYGENILISAELPCNANDVRVFCCDKNIEFEYDEKTGKLNCTYKPEATGEHRIWICYNGKKTYADFLCVHKFEDLVKRRIDFIIDNQQYKRKDSPLFGAFLIYDNREKHMVFDDTISDHNACRERIGMALLIAKYLRKHDDEKLRNSINLFINFVKREFYDENTGEVFDTIGKNSQFVRLYNAPWLMTLFAEMYFITRNEYYLEHILKMVENYYSKGGYKFYPNGFSLKTIIGAFMTAKRYDDVEKMKKYFEKHIANMIKNGTSYPKHEVNYEQTIVTPAASMISEYADLFDSESCRINAKMHIEILERFNGKQPSFHMNEIPIRFWDDYWFGKSGLFGDTFPHYWSCLTARAYMDYYEISGDEKYKVAAEKCIRNCLCLFSDNGQASCAYVYPYKVWDSSGQFYDEWANDQEFALYFAMDMF